MRSSWRIAVLLPIGLAASAWCAAAVAGRAAEHGFAPEAALRARHLTDGGGA